MELDEQRAKRWDRGADASIATAVTCAAQEKHMSKINGTIEELVESSLVQKGWLQAMSAIMAVTLAIGSVVGIIEAIARWG